MWLKAATKVRAGVSTLVETPWVFADQGVKIRNENDKNQICEPHALSLPNTLFDGGCWWFLQNSAPTHETILTHNSSCNNLPGFISTTERPASSPELNPHDYFVWPKLDKLFLVVYGLHDRDEQCDNLVQSLSGENFIKASLAPSCDAVPRSVGGKYLAVKADVFCKSAYDSCRDGDGVVRVHGKWWVGYRWYGIGSGKRSYSKQQ